MLWQCVLLCLISKKGLVIIQMGMDFNINCGITYE